MRRLLFYHVFIVCAWGAAAACAAPVMGVQKLPLPKSAAQDSKSVLVVQFASPMQENKSLTSAIAQAKLEMPRLQSVELSSERDILPTLEQRIDDGVGLVILIAPQHPDIIAPVPGLYPDVKFTLIDAAEPLYATNVQNVRFRYDEGAFLLGAIAGARGNQKIILVAQEGDKNKQVAFDYFTQGVHHIQPQIKVEERKLTPGDLQNIGLESVLAEIFKSGTDVVFSTDREVVEHALRAAKPERRLVLYDNPPDKAMDTDRLLTYMVRRHDLALLDVVHIYQHKQWRDGVISLGVGGGYVDYALNQDNVEIFPKNAIDTIEAIKDYISQGYLLQKESTTKTAR